MKNTNITRHYEERFEDRAGVSGKLAAKYAEKAFTMGNTAADFRGERRRYLLDRCSSGASAYAYQGLCFIFSNNGTCITVFRLPGWFLHGKKYAGKERIRNIHSYMKHYAFPDTETGHCLAS